MGDPVAERAAEVEARPSAVAAAQGSLDIWRQAAALWPQQRAWLNATDIQALLDAVRDPSAPVNPPAARGLLGLSRPLSRHGSSTVASLICLGLDAMASHRMSTRIESCHLPTAETSLDKCPRKRHKIGAF